MITARSISPACHSDCSDAGPRHSWPCQRGFERFYGFLDGFTNLHQPLLTKPFSFEKLEETLVTLMRGSAARSARTPAGANM